MLETSNPILQEDLANISKRCNFCHLANKTILVTGAAGLIGCQIVLTLLYLNRTFNLNVKIFALARNREKINQIFGSLLDRENFEIIFADICNSVKTADPIDYIIHCASPSQSKFFIENPVETMRTIVYGTDNLLRLAKEKKVKSFVFLSTMEVFGELCGADGKGAAALKENEYGYIDILKARSSYPESKRLAESLCFAYFFQYKLPVKIARLTQTIAPFAFAGDNRIAVYFAKCFLENRDIELLTSGALIRNTIYSTDAIAAIFKILFEGKDGEAYNTANKNAALSIYETAQMIAGKIAGGQIKVKAAKEEREDIGKETAHFSPETKLLLNTDKLEALGWSAEIGLEEMYKRLIEGMKYKDK